MTARGTALRQGVPLRSCESEKESERSVTDDVDDPTPYVGSHRDGTWTEWVANRASREKARCLLGRSQCLQGNPRACHFLQTRPERCPVVVVQGVATSKMDWELEMARRSAKTKQRKWYFFERLFGH